MDFYIHVVYVLLEYKSNAVNTLLTLRILLLQWRILCFIIKLSLAGFTILIAIGGAVQGTLGYRDYCRTEDLCRFSKRSDGVDDKRSFDFVTVVVFSATNAVWWVSAIYACI